MRVKSINKDDQDGGVVKLDVVDAATRDAIQEAARWLCVDMDGIPVCTLEAGLNTCNVSACLNAGTCTTASSGYKCACAAAYTGNVCE